MGARSGTAQSGKYLVLQAAEGRKARHFDPWRGAMISEAWRAALARLAEGWVPPAELIKEMVSRSGVKRKTAENLIYRAKEYGVVVQYGKADRQRDWRLYGLVPQSMHADRPWSLVWYDEALSDAADMLSTGAENPAARSQVELWLDAYLIDHEGPCVPSAEVKAAGRAEGFPERTIKRAAQKMGVRFVRRGKTTCWSR